MEATTTANAMFDESNKENTPPVCIKGEKKKKKKNPIPPMAPSFKKNTKRKMKRIPLADITHLFNNSAPITMAQEQNGVSSLPSSASVLLHSNSRRGTLVVVPGSKTLRMGFR